MTVEELRNKVFSHATTNSEDIDALISAVDFRAFTKGKIEGAAKMKEEIRKAILVFACDSTRKWTLREILDSIFPDPPEAHLSEEEIMLREMGEQVMEDQQKEAELAEDRKRNEREADVERWKAENLPKEKR